MAVRHGAFICYKGTALGKAVKQTNLGVAPHSAVHDIDIIVSQSSSVVGHDHSQNAGASGVFCGSQRVCIDLSTGKSQVVDGQRSLIIGNPASVIVAGAAITRNSGAIRSHISFVHLEIGDGIPITIDDQNAP